jgi:hypothetical protein
LDLLHLTDARTNFLRTLSKNSLLTPKVKRFATFRLKVVAQYGRPFGVRQYFKHIVFSVFDGISLKAIARSELNIMTAKVHSVNIEFLKLMQSSAFSARRRALHSGSLKGRGIEPCFGDDFS